MNQNQIHRTELSAIGEFGLIDHLTHDITLIQPSTVKGIGDDAAVIDIGDEYILVTTDLLIEGVHFDTTYTPLKHLGYKSIAVNLSDICAMNGTPTQVLVSISVSNRYSVEALSELYEGIKLACNRYKVDLIGGDTTSSVSGMFISVTALGKVAKTEVCYRSTAKPNHLICVTGDLGAAYLGLLLLEREKSVFLNNPGMQPDLGGNDYILQRQLKPEPRFDMLASLKKNEVVPTSMIDISDGLASEMLHICKESKVGCRIYEDKIPIDGTTVNTAEEFGISPVTAAMNGGEDYELLFTVNTDDFQKIKDLSDIHVIGHITEDPSDIHLVTSGGGLVALRAQGWNHMK